MLYLKKTMDKINFKKAHGSLHKFCKTEHIMCIPATKDDDDIIISETLDVAEYQIDKMKKIINELIELSECQYRCRSECNQNTKNKCFACEIKYEGIQDIQIE